MHYAFHYADLGVLEGWPISGRKRFYMEAIIILYHIHDFMNITSSILFNSNIKILMEIRFIF